NRFGNNWQSVGLERCDCIDALRRADMYRIERASELIGYQAVGVYLHTLGPLRAALGPRGQIVAPAQAPQFIHQDPAHERIFGVDHRKHWAPGGVDGAAGFKEEGRADAVLVHAEALSLCAGVAGKELVGNSALAGDCGYLFDLVERVDHAGNLEVAPTERLAAF